MKDDYSVHNLFWENLKKYEELDPHLSKLNKASLVYSPPLVKDIPVLTPGIYILTGGRQVGKSTALKLIIKRLLRQKLMPPDQIFYLPCDTIKDYTQLLFEIEQFRPLTAGNTTPFILFVDEVSYVKEWHRAIKSLADAGFFNYGSILITGSDTYLLKNATMEFPGRRGTANLQDFHLSPLSFSEYLLLKDEKSNAYFKETRSFFQENLEFPSKPVDEQAIGRLWEVFNAYMITGGYLLAINNFEKNKTINDASYKTYTQWIIGDILKRGKNEASLKEIIKALFLRLSKQITWHSLVNDVSIEHHQTIIDYIDLLTRMDVLVVLQALREDKLRPAPKKAKKICFSDPFIFHALHGLLFAKDDFFHFENKFLFPPSDMKNALIEGIISSLFRRKWESYYIKAEGEVDLAIILNKRFLPVEIKNSMLLDKKDLKQIIKYKRGIIGYAGQKIDQFENLQVVPIPLLAYVAA